MQDFTFLVSLCLISLLSSCSVWSFRSAENIKKKMTFLMRKFGVLPGSRQWWAQPNKQLAVVCFGNSVHLWCELEHGVTSLWGHGAGGSASSELHGDLMKQPRQRCTRINFRRKINTLHSWSIILFYSPYCWGHSCCQMLRSHCSISREGPFCPQAASLLALAGTLAFPAMRPFLLPGLLCRALSSAPVSVCCAY